jgi:hypothetical protein
LVSEVANWLINDDHHSGYEARLEEKKKQIKQQQDEFEKQRAELNAKKHAQFIECERLNNELRRYRGSSGMDTAVYDSIPRPQPTTSAAAPSGYGNVPPQRPATKYPSTQRFYTP